MRRVNRPKTKGEGIATLTIANVEYKKFINKQAAKKGLAEDEREFMGYKVTFICDGIAGEFEISEQCGDRFNDEPVKTTHRGKNKHYNKLVTLLMALDLVSEDDLETCDPAELHDKLLEVGGTQYEGKLVRDGGFYRVDIGSLKPVG